MFQDDSPIHSPAMFQDDSPIPAPAMFQDDSQVKHEKISISFEYAYLFYSK